MILATFLRIGESLDRSHAALVQHVRFSFVDEVEARVEIVARGDCHLELWGIDGEKKAFEKVFSKKLVFEVLAPGTPPDG